jgi:hypothetical protein
MKFPFRSTHLHISKAARFYIVPQVISYDDDTRGATANPEKKKRLHP